MIDITLGQLADLRPALGWASGLNLSQADAFYLARKVFKVDEELRLFGTRHDEIVKKFGARDEKTGAIVVAPDSPNRSAANQAISDLRSVKVELAIAPIKASMLQKAAPQETSAAPLVALMPLLDWDIAEE